MSDMHDMAAPYVLGALSNDELDAYRRHLDDCQVCQDEVTRLGQGLVALTMSDGEAPSEHLRAQILASIEPEAPPAISLESRRSTLRYALVAVAAAVALIFATLTVIDRNPAEEILAAPDSVSVNLTVTDSYTGPSPTVARVVFSASEEAAAVELVGLVDPSAETIYQLWLIDSGGAVSAGTFRPDGEGTAIVRLEGAPVSGDVVGITEEPSGGSRSPTGDVLFQAGI